MPRRSIAFATYDRASALTDDDRLVVPALAARGIDVVPAVWSDPAIDWRRFDAVVLRSTWDYHRRVPEFRDWLDRLEGQDVPLWNPAALVRWNMDKRYLRDLAAHGIPTVPTAWIAAEGEVSLAAAMDARGWSDVVLKPVIAATSHRTVRLSRAGAALAPAALAGVLEHGAAMLQPFLSEIAEEGEWSLVYFGGEYSHAVLKRPAAGDFRVQMEFGGSAIAADAPAELRASAARILDIAARPWLFARVDGVRGPHGELLLMELEMLEPSLFLAVDPAAPARFASAIQRALAP